MKIIVILVVFFASVCYAETYQQCKKRVLSEITQYEKNKNKKVSKKNKKLAIVAYCKGLPK